MKPLSIGKQVTLGESILEKHRLCKHCLVRQINSTENALRSRVRGSSPKTCIVCQGLMSNLRSVAKEIVSQLSSYDYDTFQIGSSIPTEIQEAEDMVRSEFKLMGGETLKSALSRELRRLVSERTGKTWEYRNPDLVVHVKPLSGEVYIRPKSLFLYGRYVKKTRGLLQKKRTCRICRGRGCEDCHFAGKADDPSVEDRLSERVLNHFKGRRLKITWIGGEDPESLVLGNGRPFYAEVIEPKVRTLEKSSILDPGGDVFISTAELTDGNKQRNINFIFRAKVQASLGGRIGRYKANRLLASFRDREIEVHPVGGNKVLKRRVYGISVDKLEGREAGLEIRCDGGVSVKGLVGDEGFGRSVVYVSPNISEVLGMPCKCVYFDVVEVEHPAPTP